VLVALAGMGGTPVNSSAGKAIKLPPPATELSAPPNAPATNRKMMVASVKVLGVSEIPLGGQWSMRNKDSKTDAQPTRSLTDPFRTYKP